jgi:hypothetical protein
MTRRGSFDRFLKSAALAFAGALFALMFVLAPESRAASVTYPAGNASNFATGAGGWTSDEDYDGLCIQNVTCPAVSGEFRASGGADGVGDGFIRSISGPTSVAALLSTSVQTWNSPAFTYRGVSGSPAASLTFSIFKRSSYQELLQLGATATYSVTAINESGGPNRVLVPEETVGTNDEWQRAAREPILADALKVGDQYSIQIRTKVGDLASILPGGQIDYDDVSLFASDGAGSGGNGGNGGNGNDGGNGNNGGNGNDGTNGSNGSNGSNNIPAAVPQPIRPGVGYLHKGRLYVRIKCPKRFKPKCNVRAVAKTKRRKGKAITKKIRASVKSKRFKSKGLKVKPKFKKRLRRLSKVNQKTIVLKLRIKSKRGKKKGTVYHHLKVRTAKRK